MTTITHSDQETKKIAEDLALRLKGGDIVCLYGELGAGKTTFVKGLAQGLGVKNEITSPTFTLLNIYHTNSSPEEMQLVHIDTYRLKTEQELLDIGVTDYLGEPRVITVIEWPEKIAGLLQNKKVINVLIDHQEETVRKITID